LISAACGRKRLNWMNTKNILVRIRIMDFGFFIVYGFLRDNARVFLHPGNF
jgi:hypothetical protein